MRIIPAIDILGGKCTRLTKGDFNSAINYSDDPVNVARNIDDHGLKYLHLVDLDGARQGSVQHIKILKQITSETALKVDFSGGISSLEIAEKVFDSGANQIILGSMAIENPNLFASILNRFGNERVVLGADSIGGKIAYKGWQENSGIDLFEFISDHIAMGVSNIMCTSISKDGAMEGPDLDLYSKILARFDVNLIASGGIRSVQDVEEARTTGCEGAIIGKAFYEGKISLKEMAGLC